MPRQAFPDIQWNLQELIAEDKKVFFRWTISASHQHNFNNIPATGKL
ncbi:MAG: ester cyclase [Pseudobacter sp.]